MKFNTKYINQQVPEWENKYIDYKKLKTQVKKIKTSALALAAVLSHEADPDAPPPRIVISNLKDEKLFFQMLDESVNDVEQFYKQQLTSFINRFHYLTLKTINLGLMDEYVPEKRGISSRLERELARLHTEVEVVVGAHDDDEEEEEQEDSLMGGSLQFADINNSFPLRRITKQKSDKFVKPQTTSKRRLRTITLEETSNELLGITVDANKIKNAFAEFYRGLILLENYADLNMLAVQKILKKHDKIIGLTTKSEYMKKVKEQDFAKKDDLKILLTETEHVYSLGFTKGHRTKAMEFLRVPTEEKSVEASNLRLGLYVGISLPVMVVLTYLLILSPPSFPRLNSILVIYRMLGMAILMLWCWGFDMWMWTRARVNYVFIFEFDPRRHIRYQNIFEAAALFSVVWVISFFLYVISAVQPPGFSFLNYIPFQTHPLIFLSICLVVFLVYSHKSNYWLIRTLTRIVCAPFFQVVFRDFYLADQLASVVIVLFDLEYTLCFFAYDAWTGTDVCFEANKYVRPIIGILPASWRLLQCLRRYRDSKDKSQLMNAGKYSSSLFVTLFSALQSNTQNRYLFGVWLFFISVSTCYTFSWDVWKDWGLGDRKASGLRAKLLYPSKAMYYFAIGSNLIMRLMWTLTISPESIGIVMDPLLFATILAGVEILRRAQWNLYRLENEHLSNVGKFRAIADPVPMPPQAKAAWE